MYKNACFVINYLVSKMYLDLYNFFLKPDKQEDSFISCQKTSNNYVFINFLLYVLLLLKRSYQMCQYVSNLHD